MAYHTNSTYTKKAYLLDLFQLEETSITSLGVSVEREKSILLLSSIGLVSACVAVSGSIGFIGLMAPHIAKRLVGIQHKHIIPTCGVIGMFLVVLQTLLQNSFHTCRVTSWNRYFYCRCTLFLIFTL